MKPSRTMARACATMLVASVAWLPAVASANLFSLSRDYSRLWLVNEPSDADTALYTTYNGFLGCYAFGLATQPTTGTMFAVTDAATCSQGNRSLVTIDPLTGVETLVGSVSSGGYRVASITFGADQNTLYAATGSSGTSAESLFTVDPGTGALTLKCTLQTGNGHALSFANNLVYHGYQDCNDNCQLKLEVINPSSFPATNTDPCNGTIIDTGSSYFEPTAMTLDSTDGSSVTFLATYYNQLYQVTVPGESSAADFTFLKYLDENSKGLAFNSADVVNGDLTLDVQIDRYRMHGVRSLWYYLTPQNAGPDTMDPVTIEMPVPSGTEVLDLDSGCEEDAGTVTCSLGAVATTTNVTKLVRFRVLCKKCSTVFHDISIGTTMEGAYDNPWNDFFTGTVSVKGKFLH